MGERSVPQPCETLYWVAGVSNPHGDGSCFLMAGKEGAMMGRKRNCYSTPLPAGFART